MDSDLTTTTKNLILAHLAKNDLGSYLTENLNNDSEQCLYKIMYDKNRTDEWTKASIEVGIFLGKYRRCSERKKMPLAYVDICETSVLYDWLLSLDTSDDALIKMLPKWFKESKRVLKHTHLVRERCKEALAILSQTDCVVCQNILIRNFEFANDKLQIDANTLKPAFGPWILDVAIIMADIYLMFTKLCGVIDHKYQVVSASMPYKLGAVVDEELARQGVDEKGIARLWANVSLLTGWEIIRRYVVEDDVTEILLDRSINKCARTNMGLSLIEQEKIDSYGYMTSIALSF